MTAAWAEGTGNGTKEHPYSGEWSIPELYNRVQKGDHIALDCDVKRDGDGYITIYDVKLDKDPVVLWDAWSPGNLIGATTLEGDYAQYGKDNPYDNRKGQTFIVTDKCPDDRSANYTGYMIKGYFSGFYTTTDALGWVYVESAEQMMIILRGNSNVRANTSAKIKLTQDIYLSDNTSDATFCSTFYGTLDGDGHTISGSRDGLRNNRNYLFTYSDGATFKNLTFMHHRKNSEDHENQAIITSQAKNHCVFENITLDDVGTWSDTNKAAGLAGYAENCSFKDITVKNSDFTVDNAMTGAVAGEASHCSFENIKVINCESTTDNERAGGVVGQCDNCTFNNVEILGCFIKSYDVAAGGITGKSSKSHYSNCIIDDQSCVYADRPLPGSGWHSRVGGIVGHSDLDVIENCINSALICGDGDCVGGIVGCHDDGGEITIENCLNTGMIISMDIDDVKGADGYYSKYKNKKLPCVTKYYNGKEYIVRKTDYIKTNFSGYGGILGSTDNCTISKCANIGSMNDHGDKTGGIVGWCKYAATLSDCLSAFESPKDNIKGFIGVVFIEGCKITNCMSTKTAKDYEEVSGTTFVVNNVFSRTRGNLTDVKLASGEICHALGENWEQNLGTDAYPTPTGNKGLYHTRKVTNQYGTVCLPFPVKSDDKISYYTLNAEKVEGQDIKLVFKYVEENQPGFPVLFRAAEATDADAENPVDIYFSNAGDAFTRDPKADISVEHWGIWGTFEQEVFDESNHLYSPKNIYYVSGGEIRNAKKVTIAPYRAWFLGPNIDTLTGNGTNQAKAIRLTIEDADGETTALEFVGNDLKPVQNGKSYSIMGTEVGENYRGIVIRNGKKMIQNR